MDQILDLNNPRRNIGEAHSHALADSFRNYKYHYVHGVMTVYFSSAVIPDGVLCASAVHTIHGRKLLKDGICMVMPDKRHCRRALTMVTHKDSVW